MKETLRKKLIEYWKRDYSDELVAQACDISLDDLRLLLDEDESLQKERRKALSYLRMKSRDNIFEAIEEGELKTTKWFEEIREPETYSRKSSVNVTTDIPLAEKKQMIEDMFKDYE